jgi:hypothetical protein
VAVSFGLWKAIASRYINVHGERGVVAVLGKESGPAGATEVLGLQGGLDGVAEVMRAMPAGETSSPPGRAVQQTRRNGEFAVGG